MLCQVPYGASEYLRVVVDIRDGRAFLEKTYLGVALQQFWLPKNWIYQT